MMYLFVQDDQFLIYSYRYNIMSAIIRTVSVCDAVVAVEKMDLILSSASAWRCQYKEVLDVEDMLVPECGESFMMLMQTITGKHRFSAKDSLYTMNYIPQGSQTSYFSYFSYQTSRNLLL